MTTKTITITEDAYNILRSWRDDNESFSQIISKLGKKQKLSDIAGLLSNKEADELERRIKDSRMQSKKRSFA
jgi:predicted CopG family antitoxin